MGILALAFLLTSALTSCDLLDDPVVETTQIVEEKPTVKPTINEDKINTHDEFMAAKKGDKLRIQGYIQGKQIYDEAKLCTTLYVQDDTAGYMIYRLPCTKEEYDNDLVLGQRLEINGKKAIWHGLHEVASPSYKKLEGNKIYDPVSFDNLDSEKLKAICGTKVEIKNLTVVDVFEIERGETDFYYQVTDGNEVLTFCVETDLCLATSEEYKNALTIKKGDVIDATGMMFVYDNAQLHTTKITKSGVNVLKKSEGSLSYDEFMASEVGSTVTIEAFIQAKQNYYDGHTNLYLADENGAYYVYKLYCTEDEYQNKLKPGVKIRITGERGCWDGMDELLGDGKKRASFTILDGIYRAPVKDLTKEFESPDLIKYPAQYVMFRGLSVVGKVELEKGDLYYKVKSGNTTLTFCVESYLTGQGTVVYENVSNLIPNDKVIVEGFIFIYDGKAQLHTTKCHRLS